MWVNSGLVCRWRLIGQYWELVLTSHILIFSYPYPYPYKYLYQYHSTLQHHAVTATALHHNICTRDTWGISHFFILAILFMPGHHFFIFSFNLGSNSFISPSRVASEHLSLHLPSDQNSQYSETAQVRCVGVPRPCPVLVQTRGGGTKVIETHLCFVRLVWRCYWIVLITV